MTGIEIDSDVGKPIIRFPLVYTKRTMGDVVEESFKLHQTRGPQNYAFIITREICVKLFCKEK